jgi:hypothetical protein
MKKIIIVIGVLLLISFGIEKLYSAEVEGVTDDLSGKTSKVIAVIEGDTIILSDGTRIQESEFNSTLDKAEKILDKLEKIEIAKGKVYYDKIDIIEPSKVNDQYCFIKVVITQKGDSLIKEEVMECADGRKRFDGPSYWELFAQFYYRDISAPEYCRQYSRPKHVFKAFGKTNGEWEVQ